MRQAPWGRLFVGWCEGEREGGGVIARESWMKEGRGCRACAVSDSVSFFSFFFFLFFSFLFELLRQCYSLSDAGAALAWLLRRGAVTRWRDVAATTLTAAARSGNSAHAGMGVVTAPLWDSLESVSCPQFLVELHIGEPGRDVRGGGVGV
jgi:hypothetical protein